MASPGTAFRRDKRLARFFKLDATPRKRLRTAIEFLRGVGAVAEIASSGLSTAAGADEAARRSLRTAATTPVYAAH